MGKNEAKQNKEDMQHENKLRELNDSIKGNNFHIVGFPAEDREKGTENLFKERS